ncbi:DUF1642 domain-containing protein [Streptococcus sp. 27098_8_109]|uniref:DUF1642 domain-containing protein n=1 Tax=Streptococcus sp. 27098_8_109 TaxID=3003659 RepID=UPI00352F5935
MNKQELIERIEAVPAHNTRTRPWIDKRVVLGLIRLLDEPKKPVVSQFVADWYEKHKYALEFNIFDYVYRFEQQAENDFKDWFDDINTKAIQILVNMHQFGYEIEEEKRYLVKFKGFNSSYIILKHRHYGNTWFLGGEQEYEFYRLHHTRKQLEEAGFGWVFSCEGIEIEEV